MSDTKPEEAFRRLYDIIVRLRSPEGCPWDREQTPASMRGHLLEEAYESIDAIDAGGPEDVEEELGDVYLLVTMLARMYEERGEFSVSGVLDSICRKLVRRHPHVFGDAKAESPDEVVDQWQRIKVQEGKRERTGGLDGVSRTLPAMERAYRLQGAAAAVGFDWPTFSGVREKLLEEIEEVMVVAGGEAALERTRLDRDAVSAELEDEVGDLLFSAVNLSRYLGVDPSMALHRANSKFSERFHLVERRMRDAGVSMSAERLEVMDRIWNEAKRAEKITSENNPQ